MADLNPIIEKVKANTATEVSFDLSDVDEGSSVRSLVHALRANTSVKSLTIHGDSDCVVFGCDILEVNRTITSFKIETAADDSIFPHHIDRLIETLQSNGSITSLNLEINRSFGDWLADKDAEIHKLPRAIGANHQLMKVEVIEYSLDPALVKAIYSQAIIAGGSKNILSFNWANEQLAKLCQENKERAEWLLNKIFRFIRLNAEPVTDLLPEIHQRMPALVALLRERQSDELVKDYLSPITKLITEKGLDKNAVVKEKPIIAAIELTHKAVISPHTIREQLKARSGVTIREA